MQTALFNNNDADQLVTLSVITSKYCYPNAFSLL